MKYFLYIVVNVYFKHVLMVIVPGHDELKVAVKDGQRPELDVLSGPETLMPLAADWMKRCWDQSPDVRPTFAGI